MIDLASVPTEWTVSNVASCYDFVDKVDDKRQREDDCDFTLVLSDVVSGKDEPAYDRTDSNDGIVHRKIDTHEKYDYSPKWRRVGDYYFSHLCRCLRISKRSGDADPEG